ncbi:hypothetical protein [Rhizobium sp. FY34]|uniref:hypothetical protein n=1 Tax=Rhizobium sp. FY34 TaxID=2562309 RepID=UPI0032B196CA
MICRALLWLGASLMLMSVDLPESGPRPDAKPVAESASPEAPKPPEPRPAAGAGAVETPAAGEIPIPEEKP